MPTQDDIANQQHFLAAHRATLAHYLRQRAQLGTAHEPPGVANGIAEARASIVRCKATLRSWGIDVLDHPDDADADLVTMPPTLTAPTLLTSLPKKEKLYTNLLTVTACAQTIYIAETDCQLPRDVWAKIREQQQEVGSEWILKNKRILSFHNLEAPPWSTICDLGTLESFDVDEWAYSDDQDRQREFVQLLNWSLREKIYADLRYSKEKECYFFKPTADLSERVMPYHSIKIDTERRIFQGYPRKDTSGRIAYYRHSAFQGYFRRFDHTWFLEITPTHYYTADGYRLDIYYESRLSGMRQLERNQTLLGQLMMWAAYLSQPADLFTSAYPFLEFGELQSFALGVGVDDDTWLGHEEGDNSKMDRKPSNQLSMFDE
jgi:hypothetical protein